MQNLKFIFLMLICFAANLTFSQSNSFIKVSGKHLVKDDHPYYFIGTNAWYFVNIASTGEGGDRGRLIKELDLLKELGITNLRIMAGTEGPESEPFRIHPAIQNEPKKYSKDLLNGLDFLLVELAKRNMKAVLCLNNFFMWSGGMAQYVSWAEGSKIPYPQNNTGTWDEFQAYSARFYANEQAQKLFDHFLRKLINRKNTINGIAYKNDPTIMAWQLGNEPRGRQNVMEYIIWADKTAGLIQSLAPNHLVSLGGEGLLPDDGRDTGFKVISQSKNIDYLTMHLWIENWGWYRPKDPGETFERSIERSKEYLAEHISFANAVNKPVVLEEFGVSRDSGSFESTSSSSYRDRFYSFIFDYILQSGQQDDVLAGCNFWSWTGIVNNWNAGQFWQAGDPFTGDPPHEFQGWYSVHFEDKTTLSIINEAIFELNKIRSSKLSLQD